MIDWHSHLLPAIDDGSRSVSESLSILEMMASQGVNTVVATPHFYANAEQVDKFLERREKSFEDLKSRLPENSPNILLGAEVKYYPGISKLESLEKLTAQGSKLLLLEMPMIKWTEYTVRELEELASLKGITVMLAHIERYLKLQSSDVWNRLYESGVLMQVNASFFLEFRTRRKALEMLKNGKIHFIGSDCHNITSRPPRIGKAYENIKKKFGERFINQINEYGATHLSKNI